MKKQEQFVVKMASDDLYILHANLLADEQLYCSQLIRSPCWKSSKANMRVNGIVAIHGALFPYIEDQTSKVPYSLFDQKLRPLRRGTKTNNSFDPSKDLYRG